VFDIAFLYEGSSSSSSSYLLTVSMSDSSGHSAICPSNSAILGSQVAVSCMWNGGGIAFSSTLPETFFLWWHCTSDGDCFRYGDGWCMNGGYAWGGGSCTQTCPTPGCCAQRPSVICGQGDAGLCESTCFTGGVCNANECVLGTCQCQSMAPPNFPCNDLITNAWPCCPDGC
jgi:hypothetical protein